LTVRLHLDTDFGGDPDDACALAMLPGWPGVDLVGITTVADPDGRRAGYVRRLLQLTGRPEVPVARGAGRSTTTGEPMGGLPDHDRYWGPAIDPPGPESGRATAGRLLRTSIEAGATVVAIGPATNLGRLETARPGVLRGVPVVMMGGWTGPLDPGLPPWGPERDWNVQCDTGAAEVLLAAGADLTLVPIAVTAWTSLGERHLPRLRAAGRLGALLARQAEAYAADAGRLALRSFPAIADDHLNFHHDPLAAAVAAGWADVERSDLLLRPVQEGGVLRFEAGEGGRPATVVTGVDADRFAEAWLAAVEAAAHG